MWNLNDFLVKLNVSNIIWLSFDKRWLFVHNRFLVVFNGLITSIFFDRMKGFYSLPNLHKICIPSWIFKTMDEMCCHQKCPRLIAIRSSCLSALKLCGIQWISGTTQRFQTTFVSYLMNVNGFGYSSSVTFWLFCGLITILFLDEWNSTIPCLILTISAFFLEFPKLIMCGSHVRRQL